MQVSKIETVQQLIDAAKEASHGFGNRITWFRGQQRHGPDRRLVAPIHRESYPAMELEVTNRFRQWAPVRHSGCPHHKEEAQWLSLMQHYGLPTRLLDWTRSILVAAFFAVAYKEEPGDGVIWALAPSKLNQVSGKCLTILQLDGRDSLVKAAFDPSAPTDDVRAVVPDEFDLHMLLQQSVFTIHGSGRPLEEHDLAHTFLKKFVVPEKAKEDFRSVLSLVWITQATLFPDLEHLAKEVAQRARRQMGIREQMESAGGTP